jgi:restriction system protein
MNFEKLEIKITQDYYANWDTKYIAELEHKGLNEHRILVGRDSELLDIRVSRLAEKWDIRWKKLSEKIKNENLIKDLDKKAEEKDIEVKIFIEETKNILFNTLEIDDTIDWELLKDYTEFKEEAPLKPEIPRKPSKKKVELTDKKEFPKITDKRFELKLSFIDKIIKSRGERKKESIKLKFETVLKEIDSHNKEIEVENQKLIEKEKQAYSKRYKKWEKHVESLNSYYKSECLIFEDKKTKFYHDIDNNNKLVDEFKKRYLELDSEAIEQYCNLVLSNSIYPASFPQEFELEYSPNNKSLIVDYRLPSLYQIPSIKEYKFIKTKKEIKEIPLSQSEINKLFDNIIYQICLRTIHELIEADSVNALDMITLNGFVKFINKANGKEENSCIISLQVSKDEFLSINLSRVEPKDCFKGLKGIGSSKLHGLSAIKPILDMNRSDSRIAESYSVVGDLNESVNLAMMDWEDFENLVRELFAKEFTNEGAEVHVTQASRDGGVDAIAFDPDPIRGGKMVIQAKRYTNTVGVSAVRDLYGTVVNEGAIKGILVSTADYGPDAYKFAKDKPLTLLNGNNLLHMLMKHGIKAKIDIKEAKKYFKENSEK